jgi:TM2 domain-containing membrane protein YozV
MDTQRVDMYITVNAKYFESHLIPQVHDMLLKADDAKFMMLQSVKLNDPTTLLIVSLFGGHFGIDRFLIGDTGLGVAKLLTCGGLGIWSIVDWFLIMGRTKEVNFTNLQQVLY